MPNHFEGRYYPRGSIQGFGTEGDPLTTAVDFHLIIEKDSIGGRYLGSSTQIPLNICRDIEQAILAISYSGRPVKGLRTKPYVVLSKVTVGVK